MKFWQTIRAAINPRPLSQAKVNQLNAEAKEFFDKLVTTGKISAPDTPLVLRADEAALLHEPSKLIQARATRVYSGGGVHLKGIYIGGGESSSSRLEASRFRDADAYNQKTGFHGFDGKQGC